MVPEICATSCDVVLGWELVLLCRVTRAQWIQTSQFSACALTVYQVLIQCNTPCCSISVQLIGPASLHWRKRHSLHAQLLCVHSVQGNIDPEEWMFLLTGGLGDAGAAPSPAQSWLGERAWKELLRLSKLPSFKVQHSPLPKPFQVSTYDMIKALTTVKD